MTDLQHALVGGLVFMVLWNLFIKRHFKTEKAEMEWDEVLRKFFKN